MDKHDEKPLLRERYPDLPYGIGWKDFIRPKNKKKSEKKKSEKKVEEADEKASKNADPK